MIKDLSIETQIKFDTAMADGKISAEEWKLFSKDEQEQLGMALRGNILEEKSSNWFSDWINDKDKICTDGKDDGSLSFCEAAESFGKGLLGIVKGVVKHPIATAATIGLGALATAVTGGAALPLMIALGVGTGAFMIGKGAYEAVTAKTDAEAKAAWEGIGTGTFSLVSSALGAKASLKAASKAGVTSAQGVEDMNIAQATVRNFKVLPESLKVSRSNMKNFFVKSSLSPNLSPHKDTILATDKDILQLQKEGYYISVNENKQVFAYNSDNKMIELGRLGEIKLSTLKINLKNAQSKGLIIDLTKLDPEKTYVGMQYGIDKTAKGIQICTQSYCPDSEVPSHIFSLINENGEWVIYQSNGHATPSLGTSAGVNRASAIDWIALAQNQVKRFEVYEMPIDKAILQSRLGEGYGRGDIVNLLKAFLFNSNGKQGDASGLMCSEYVALSSSEIQNFYNLPAWCITPAHFKNYILQNNIPVM